MEVYFKVSELYLVLVSQNPRAVRRIPNRFFGETLRIPKLGFIFYLSMQFIICIEIQLLFTVLRLAKESI